MPKKTRNNHAPAFRAKVALGAVQEQQTVPGLERRYKIHANLIYKWKREFIENAARAFETPGATSGSGEERKAELLQKIGELTMETSNGSSCSNLSRRAKEAIRYLRDPYDTHNDPGYNDGVSHSYANFVDALAAMPSGTSNGQRNGLWATLSPFSMDNEGGRSALELKLYLPTPTGTKLLYKCSPGN